MEDESPRTKLALRLQRELLDALENHAGALWLTRPIDPGYVYCFASGELVVFELLSGAAEGKPRRAEPGAGPAAIVARARNTTFLWLPGSEEWDRIVALLARAEPDRNDSYPDLYLEAQRHLVRALRRR